MIVVLNSQSTAADIERLVERITALGRKPHVIKGAERTVIAAVGSESGGDRQALEADDAVEKVVPILAPYKIASKETKSEPTQVVAGSWTVGGGVCGVAAGPCSVESEEQILASARAVKAAGATALRGGAFKPRTSPYAFQGMKEEGLKLLAAARDETGLAVVTEVMTPHHVELVARYADVMQIGARNCQNYHLLQAVGECERAVLLKRGASTTMDEFLLAAEYILDQGNHRVMLCERGIRTFESHTRFTLPLASVPYLQQRTHLPVVIDPSHGTGKASLVAPMCRAAIAAGCDGLIVEVHPDPPNAASDGAQSLDFDEFVETMTQCERIAAACDLSLR